eukprot:1094106-Pelagomonas_calceolata.AAC.5
MPQLQAICRSLAHMSASQLRLAAASSPVLTSSEFLFYLKDLEEQVRKAEQAGRRITAAGQGGPALAEQEAGQAGRTSVTKESSNTAQQEQQPGLHRQQQPAPPLQDDVHNASPQFTVTAEGASGVMNAAVWRPSGASNDNRSSDNSRHDSSSSSSSSDSSSKSSSPNSSNSAASQSLGTSTRRWLISYLWAAAVCVPSGVSTAATLNFRVVVMMLLLKNGAAQCQVQWTLEQRWCAGRALP